MPATPPIKVCPFCLVDARTNASCCAYCGSSYDHAGLASAPGNEVPHARRRTYDGVPAHAMDAAARSVTLDLA